MNQLNDYAKYMEKMGVPEPFDCGIFKYKNRAHYYHLHWHEFMELILVRKGVMLVKLQNSKLKINEGDLLVIPPGELHSSESSGEGTLEYLCITFDSRIFLNSLYENNEISLIYSYFTQHQMSQPFLYKSNEVKKAQIPSLFNNILNETQKKEAGFAFSVKADLSKIFLWLLRYKNQCTQPVNKMENLALYKKMHQVFDIIQKQFNTNISTNQIADMANMSKSHFCYLFKKITGCGFRKYMQSLRITEATKLLLSTDHNINQIAYMVGYDNFNFFVRAFKKKTGMPPLQYKKYLSSHSQSEEPADS